VVVARKFFVVVIIGFFCVLFCFTSWVAMGTKERHTESLGDGKFDPTFWNRVRFFCLFSSGCLI
jgi:hypothetical protein